MILDICLALAALFPYYLDESINNFSFVELTEFGQDKDHAEIALLTAIPMLSATFSILLLLGNRLRVTASYPLFILFNVSFTKEIYKFDYVLVDSNYLESTCYNCHLCSCFAANQRRPQS